MAGVLCRDCGTLNSQATKFCIECGTQMSAFPAPAAATALPFADSPLLKFLLEEQTGTRAAVRSAAIALIIFALAFAGYFFSTHLYPDSGPTLRWVQPLSRYTFYADLADALNHGSFDLTEVGIAPDEHPDLATIDGKVYLPYQPVPGVLLMPFVAVWGTGSTQITFSAIVGALNVVLFWWVLRLLGVSRTTKVLLIPFFAFGTANFYSATTGTLWFYNHVTAVFFLLLGIIFLIRRDSPVLPALFVGLASLCRQPAVLAAPAFIYFMVEQRSPGLLDRIHLGEMASSLIQVQGSRLQQLFRQALDAVQDAARDPKVRVGVGVFLLTLVPFALISLWYNDARFGSPFDTGLDDIYRKYSGGIPTSVYQRDVPGPLPFGEFDLRNVPLHLYTIFLMPPKFVGDGSLLQPDPYGMSVLLASSPFIFAVLVKRRNPLKQFSWIALALVPIPSLLYYSQGWVQYGYRYLMDYIPFIMILTAFGFDDHESKGMFRLKVALIVISIALGFWGRYWGTRLGW